MADLKISALPPASTPLAGTEVLPIVQSGTTRKVSVSDLTAGRAVSAGDLSYTGTLTGSTGVLNIGSGQLYKDAGGRVGIATASPSTNLSVGDDSTSVSRQISLHGPASGTNNGASINVRNGTDTVFAVGNASNIIGGAYSSDAMLFWGNAALRFYGNGAERARIDSSGNFLVATTSTAGLSSGSSTNPGFGVFGGQLRTQFNTDACAYWSKASGAANSTFHDFYSAGAQVGSITTNGTNTAYNQSSDARLKKNIAPADDAAALIDAIQIRKFDWKTNGSHQRYGMIAQELLEIAPEAVHVPEDEDKMMGVDYSKLVPMLIKEIQSLRARVAHLEGK